MLPEANVAAEPMPLEVQGTGLAIAAAVRLDLAPNGPVSARHGDKLFPVFGKQPRHRIRLVLTHGLIGRDPTATAVVVAVPAAASEGRAAAGQACAVVGEQRATVSVRGILILAFEPPGTLAAASERGAEADLDGEARFAGVAVGRRLLSRTPMQSATTPALRRLADSHQAMFADAAHVVRRESVSRRYFQEQV